LTTLKERRLIRVMFLRNDNNAAFTLSESIQFKEFLRNSATKVEKFLCSCSKFAKNAITKEKFKQMKITGSLPQIKELLEPDCVQSFILAGKHGCTVLLLPLIAEFFSSSAVTNKEKEAKVKQLRDDLKEAERITKEEFDEGMKKINETGIACFKENINTVIKPYKF